MIRDKEIVPIEILSLWQMSPVPEAVVVLDEEMEEVQEQAQEHEVLSEARTSSSCTSRA